MIHHSVVSNLPYTVLQLSGCYRGICSMIHGEMNDPLITGDESTPYAFQNLCRMSNEVIQSAQIRPTENWAKAFYH